MTGPRRHSTLTDSAPAVDANNPWPGLLAFSEDFSRFFFGRSVELDDLFRRVRRETLTVLYAQSGLGKTSLLQAGLFPRLRAEGFLPVPIRLDHGEAEPALRADADPPGRQITQAIATAIRDRGLRETSNPLAAPGPWEYLHEVNFSLPDETGSPLMPVLVFDQFEELFTLGMGRRDGGQFADRVIQVLGDLIENRPPRALEKQLAQDPALVDRYDFTRGNYRVLLSLREDYLPHLHGLRDDIGSIILNNVRLTRFDRRQALEVVERPAAERELVTRRVADAIVRTVAGRDPSEEATAFPRAGESRPADPENRESPGERLEVDPALLSLFCRELNNLRIDRRESTISLELVTRSKETVLRDFYLDCFQDLSPPPEPGVKAFVEDYLLTAKGYRDRLTLERAREILTHEYHGRAEELGILVNRRLLQVEERGKTPQIELTHDVLAPIALRERTERVHIEELRQAEERRQTELRRAEQEEREAKAREAAAAAALLAAQRQQRRTWGLLGVVAIAAGAAGVFGWEAQQKGQVARKALHTADSAKVKADTAAIRALRAESTAVKARDSLVLAASALTRSKKEAEHARDTAVTLRQVAESALAGTTREKARSDTLVTGFCGYSQDLVNTLFDSTTTNPTLLRSYSALLEQSDRAVDRMLSLSPKDPCVRRLDARVETVNTQVRRQLDDEDPKLRGVDKIRQARAKATRALAAVRTLSRFEDSASRRIAAQSYFDLTYEMWRMVSRDTTVLEGLVQMASEGVVVAERIDPGRDPGAVDRAARLRHYAALALIRLRRLDSARGMIDGGLTAIARGKRRADQNRNDLTFTESQLDMRRGELDSATGRPDQALAAFDTAVAVARERHAVMNQVGSGRWLAIAHHAKGDMAFSFKRYEEALAAYDSSVVRWGLYARRLRDADLHDSTEVVSGLQEISALRLWQERAALALDRPAQALRFGWSATDTATAIVAFRNNPETQRALQQTYDQAINLLETPSERARADSAFDTWFRRDSVRAATELSGSQAGIRPGMRAFDRSVGQIITELSRRFNRDSAGKSPAEQARLTRASQASITRYREGEVWIHRQIYRRTETAEARDSLGVALGNLSWTYLLTGRGKEAAVAAAEGLQLSPTQTYIIPNWFNAVLLSAPEPETQLLFTRFAGQDVEDPKIRFECAVLRDLAVLHGVGVASDQQIQVAERLVAKSSLTCPRPGSSTP
jgi:tetratricopeptide (TPR) repeat protein